MSPATAPRPAHDLRLMLADEAADAVPGGHALGELPQFLRKDDLLVLNDAATLPASLPGTVHGQGIELRLAAHVDGAVFRAVLFGTGDWTERTEDRPAPPRPAAGDRLAFGTLRATVLAVDEASPRLLTVGFDRDGAALWRALYAAAAPVQYSYLSRRLELWDVQTPFAGRPWAVEPPSAGLGLRWALLLALRRAGVHLARITHAAGLSSTGDAALDARLPFPERYEVPEATVRAVAAAQARGGRIIAAGTTVVRALESAADPGPLRAGTGTTTLRLGPTSELRVVDGLLTGMHEPGTSHFELLQAFAGRELLDRATARAAQAGLLAHEFGDVMLLWRTRRRPAPPSP